MMKAADNTQWSKLQTAYGTAENIPYLINTLRQAPTDKAIEILFSLANEIFHQATLFSATSITVEHLISLINTECRCKCRILELLGDIVHHTNSVYKLPFEQDNLDGGDEYKILCQENLDQIISQTHIFLPLLENTNPSLRMCASNLLIRITIAQPQLQMSICDNLWRAYDKENHPLVKASMLFDLGEHHLVQNANLHTYEDPRINFAHIFLQYQSNGKIELEDIDTLINIAKDFSNFEQRFLTFADYEDCLYHPIAKTFYTQCNNRIYGDAWGIDDNGHFPWYCRVSRLAIIELLTSVDKSMLPKVRLALLYMVNEATSYNSAQILPPIFSYLLGNEKISFNTFVNTYPDFARQIYDNVLIWADFYIASNVKVFGDYHLPLNRKEWHESLKIDQPAPHSIESANEIITKIINIKRYKKGIQQELVLADYEQTRTLKLQHIASDGFIPVISHFPNLYELDLSNSEVSAEGITQLPVFTQMRELHLAGLNLSEATLQYIGNLRNLERLTLSNTNFNANWLQHLYTLTHLKLLLIKNTGLGSKDVDKLKEHIFSVKVII